MQRMNIAYIVLYLPKQFDRSVCCCVLCFFLSIWLVGWFGSMCVLFDSENNQNKNQFESRMAICWLALVVCHWNGIRAHMMASTGEKCICVKIDNIFFRFAKLGEDGFRSIFFVCFHLFSIFQLFSVLYANIRLRFCRRYVFSTYIGSDGNDWAFMNPLHIPLFLFVHRFCRRWFKYTATSSLVPLSVVVIVVGLVFIIFHPTKINGKIQLAIRSKFYLVIINRLYMKRAHTFAHTVYRQKEHENEREKIHKNNNANQIN